MELPVYFPVTEGDIKRGIRSPNLGGHSFPCSATNAFYGIEPTDSIKQAFEKLFPGGGPGTDDVEYIFTSTRSTPQGGILYLEIGNVTCMRAGVTAISATNLTGISVRVDAADGGRDFDFEVVTAPSSATPTPIGALSLSGALSNQRDDLNVAIPAGTEWGVRVVQTSGSGRSSFRKMVVAVRLRN